MPVTTNEEWKRKFGAWKFHYAGWDNADKKHSQGATNSNLLLEGI